MESFTVVKDIAAALNSPGGVMLGVVMLGWALVSKRLVLGWVYELCEKDRDACRADLAARVTSAENELRDLRAKRAT